MGSFRNSPSSARVIMLYKIAITIKEYCGVLWNAVERGDTWAFPPRKRGVGLSRYKIALRSCERHANFSVQSHGHGRVSEWLRHFHP